jgi:hypothetical protein
LECPGLTWPIAGEERPIHGAWAHLDLNDSSGGTFAPELRIVLDTARLTSDPLNTTDGCLAIPLIGRGTIAESLELVLAFGVKVARAHGVKVAAELSDPERVARILWPVISLLLYVCTESGQIGDGLRRPVNPPPKRTRHGWRQFPANRPTNWDVGIRIGAALRRAYQQQANEDTLPTGRHLPGRTERRVKWLPPIWVNLITLTRCQRP